MRTLIDLLRRSFDEGSEGSEGSEGAEGSEGSEGSEGAGEGTPEGGTPDPLEERIGVLEAELKRARDEAASRRVTNREQAAEFESFKKGLAAALGLGEDESQEPDVEGLQKTITDLTAQNRDLILEKEWARAAEKAGADPDLTWAISRSSEFVSNLDVQSEELGASLVEYLEKAIEENPKLKAGPGAPPKSGTEIKGGTRTKTFTREELRGMTPEEIDQNWESISEQMKTGQVR